MKKETCTNCWHTKEEHTDVETGEVEGCLFFEEARTEHSMFGEQCNCEHYIGGGKDNEI